MGIRLYYAISKLVILLHPRAHLQHKTKPNIQILKEKNASSQKLLTSQRKTCLPPVHMQMTQRTLVAHDDAAEQPTTNKQTSKEASPRPRPANPPKKHPYSSHLTQQQKTLINSRITSSISPHPPTNTTTPTPHKKTHQEHPIQLTQNPPHLQSNSPDPSENPSPRTIIKLNPSEGTTHHSGWQTTKKTDTGVGETTLHTRPSPKLGQAMTGQV
ncbi:hypothetical protein M758_8G106500 [Ceratodon purpureus]|nr:hypothetical protein M758_8G106500 [Ceratodon purpureus]